MRTRSPAPSGPPRTLGRRAARLLGACAVALVCGCGPAPGEGAGPPPEPPGGTSPEERLAQLRSIGYVDFSPDAPPAGQGSGVTVWERARAADGYNLYCSRTSPEASLMDMAGNVVHRWSHPEPTGRKWSHALLLDNGDLVVVVKFSHVLRLAWDSRRIWKRRLEAHHDVAPGPDGSFLVLLRERLPHRGLEVAFPAVAWLDAGGRETRRWRAVEHLDELRARLDDRDFLDRVLDEAGGEPGVLALDDEHPYDYFHSNTVALLPDTPLGRRDGRFRAGNVLLCLRNVNQVLVLDQADLGVCWSWGAGELEWPHHPTLLPDGNLLVFDNGRERRHSRVVELVPDTGAIAWEYVAEPPGAFFSLTKGSAQRLANGNTLICEGDAGRAFEVTRAGELVWEWRNPAMEEGHRETVYRMTRVARALVEPLLAR